MPIKSEALIGFRARRSMELLMKDIIFFANRQKAVEITKEIKDIVSNCISATLNFENLPHYAEVSVSFVDNSAIQELNRKYRDKDYSTDVLSFPCSDGEEFDINLETGAAVLGDIVISVEKAQQQALDYGHTLAREIAFLTVHSCLHLLGYDHEQGIEEERAMMKVQEDILNALGYTR